MLPGVVEPRHYKSGRKLARQPNTVTDRLRESLAAILPKALRAHQRSNANHSYRKRERESQASNISRQVDDPLSVCSQTKKRCAEAHLSTDFMAEEHEQGACLETCQREGKAHTLPSVCRVADQSEEDQNKHEARRATRSWPHNGKTPWRSSSAAHSQF